MRRGMSNRRRSQRPFRPMLPAGFVGGALIGIQVTAKADPLSNFSIAPLGLSDALHTDILTGERRSSAALINAAGQVVGYSEQPLGDSWAFSWTNGSVWIADAFDANRIGFYDAQHTRIDGAQVSTASFLNDRGQVAGTSSRYNGAWPPTGESAWIYSAGQTTRVGFFDAEHTNIFGSQESYVLALNNRGDAAGRSNRFNVDAQNGQSIWLHSNGWSRRVGYFDADHTRLSDNGQFSTLVGLSDTGHATGYSERFVGNDYAGSSAWLASATAQIELGLTGPEFVRTDGFRISVTTAINPGGQVIGYTSRYSGMDELGSDAWIYNGASTTAIGLYDVDHVRSDGYRGSTAQFITSSGIAVGKSARFVADIQNGQSAWVFDGVNTSRIGLFDAEHTDPIGAQSSGNVIVHDTGVIAGQSDRYGLDYLGRSAWVHQGGTSSRVGLIDAEHTRSDDYRDSYVAALNGAGQAVGVSTRFQGMDYAGGSAWVYSSGVTTRLGLLDAQHTSDTEIQGSSPWLLNEAGQVAGVSERFAGSLQTGTSGWFYDAGTSTTTPLVFSVAADGTARTEPYYLTEDGEVFGTYDKYTGASLDGSFPFYWSSANGFHELGDLAAGGITAAGWASLNHLHRLVQDAAGVRYLIGNGTRADGSTMAFRLAVNGGGGWLNPAGGTWEVGTHWALGDAPSFKDSAVFTLSSTYQITLAADATAHSISAAAGSIKLNLNGNRMLVRSSIQTSTAKLRFMDGLVRSSSVGITSGGQIDLTDAHLIVDYTGASPLTSIHALIAAGRNAGLWNGNGLTSSVAAGDSLKALALLDNAMLGKNEFKGEPIDASSLLITITFNGDANVDGMVDTRDLLLLANSWLGPGTWINGDFDYSGFVDAHDLTLMARSWQAGTSFATAAEGHGLPGTAVPEPALVGLSILAVGLSRRRRSPAGGGQSSEN